jgi:hypothetical protein
MFENIRGEIDRLLAGMSENPADLQELEMVLREKLNEMKAFGMPLPADLVELEAALDQKLTAEEAERAGNDGS